MSKNKQKKEKKHILVETILDLLDVKSRKISEVSPVVQVGMAKLILTLKGEKSGVETDGNGMPYPFENYLEEAGIAYNKEIVKKAFRILEEQQIVKNNRLNLIEGEDIEHPVTWALWACLLDEMLEVSINEKGQRMYRNNEKGMKSIKKQ